MPNSVQINHIPTIIHFIWFGPQLSESGLQSISAWKRLHADFTVVLWVGAPEQISLYSASLEKEGVLIKAISASIIEINPKIPKGRLSNIDLIEGYLVNKNYWAASDVLRIDLQAAWGGFYFDVGTPVRGVLSQLPLPQSEGISAVFAFGVNREVSERIVGCYGFMFSKPGHVLFVLAQAVLRFLHASFESQQWKDCKLDPNSGVTVGQWLAQISGLDKLPKGCSLQQKRALLIKGMNYLVAISFTGQALFLATAILFSMHEFICRHEKPSRIDSNTEFLKAFGIYSLALSSAEDVFYFEDIFHNEALEAVLANKHASRANEQLAICANQAERDLLLWVIAMLISAVVIQKKSEANHSGQLTSARFFMKTSQERQPQLSSLHLALD